MRRRPMMKYGVVGAVALAGLVAALWDGSKKADEPKKDETAQLPSGASVVGGGMKKDEVKATDVPASDKKYVVKEGDTLYAIASHELGKGTRWQEIADLNKVTPQTLKKGQ